MNMSVSRTTAILIACVLWTSPVLAEATEPDDGFDQAVMVNKATEFFGETTEGLAKAVEHVFDDHGKPNAYITGEEFSGAIGVGVRAGANIGYLHYTDEFSWLPL